MSGYIVLEGNRHAVYIQGPDGVYRRACAVNKRSAAREYLREAEKRMAELVAAYAAVST